MRRRLATTRTRVLLALALGLIAPTLVIGVPVGVVAERDSGAAFVYVFAVCGGFVCLVMLVLGAPAWLLLHRRGAGTRLAALCGGLGSVLAIVALGLFSLAMTDGPNENTILGLVAIAIAAFFFGAGLCALMWRIAYPKALQPPAAADYF